MSKKKKNLSEEIEITEKVKSVAVEEKSIKLSNLPAPKEGIKLSESWGKKSK